MLIYTETGRTVPDWGEELTRFRRARKVLHLSDAPKGRSTLYCLVRRHANYNGPLILTLNGRSLLPQSDAPGAHYYWMAIPVPDGMLDRGANVVEAWCNADAQPAWTLALEDGHPSPGSYLSSDGGQTWQNERMGVTHTERGEYVARLCISGSESRIDLPRFAWERPDHPRLAELRRIIPTSVQGVADPWERARSLASWTSRAFPYCSAADGGRLYAPWDPATILSGRTHRLIAARSRFVSARITVFSLSPRHWRAASEPAA